MQLENLRNNISERQKNFKIQTEYFKQYSNFFDVPQEIDGAETAWLAYPIIIKDSAPFSRREFQVFLEHNNIQTRVVFTGNIIRQPMMKNKLYRVNRNGFPNADNVMKNGVLLPVHHGLTASMIERFQDTVSRFVAQF